MLLRENCGRNQHRNLFAFHHGLEGGADAHPGRNAIARADGRIEPLAACDRADLEPGDTIIIKTPGGGGFGTTKPSR